MTAVTKIEEKLKAAFDIEKLVVIDESYLHEGHAGARPGGESHFKVEIISIDFEGASRVDRQRMIYKVLQGELSTFIHALSLNVKAPSEVKK